MRKATIAYLILKLKSKQMKRLNWLTVILLVISSFTLQTVTAQNKVVILDSVTAGKVIKDLIRYDIAKQLLNNCNKRDSISQIRIKTFQKTNTSLLSAYNEKVSQSTEQDKTIDLKDKIISKEVNKKNFWKITTYLSVGLSFYVLLFR